MPWAKSFCPFGGVWDKHSKEEYDYRIMGANATNMGANATNMGANATIMGPKKREKTAEKGQILRKNDYLCKMKK